MRGDTMGIGIFVAAILCLGVFGVYMYYKAETNSYNQVVNRITFTQSEIKDLKDKVDQLDETITNLIKEMTDQDQKNKQIIELSGTIVNSVQMLDKDVDRINQRIDKIKQPSDKPLMLDLKWPPLPLAVEITKVPERKKFFQSETLVQKTKSGIVHKTSGKAIEKTLDGAYKRKFNPGLPGLKESKQTLKAMDL